MTTTALQTPITSAASPVPTSLSRWAQTVGQTITRTSTAQRIAAAAATATVLGAALWAFDEPHAAGYLGIFVLSMVASSMLFLPSGRVPILIGGSLILNPLAVAIVASVGGAIGEGAGYILGRCSNRVIKGEKTPAWLSRITERHMGLTILLGNAIPNPLVDAISIVAGRLRYSPTRFLTYAIIGKVMQSIVVVYVALWNISLVSSWMGIG